MTHTKSGSALGLAAVMLTAGLLTGCGEETKAAERSSVTAVATPVYTPVDTGAAQREARRGQLRNDIAADEEQRNALASRLETAGKLAGMCQLQVQAYQQEIEQQQIRTNAFMMDHKAVGIAIAAGVVGADTATDDGKTREQQNLGKAVVAAAAIYALTHASEVAQVLDALAQSKSHIDDLRAASGRAEAERQGAEAQAGQLRSQIAELDQKLAELRQTLAAV